MSDYQFRWICFLLLINFSVSASVDWVAFMGIGLAVMYLIGAVIAQGRGG